MAYEIKVCSYAEHPNLQEEIIQQIREGKEMLMVIDIEKDDCIFVSQNAGPDFYQAKAIAEALNKLPEVK